MKDKNLPNDIKNKSLNELKNFEDIKKIRLKKKDLLDLKGKDHQINKYIYDDLKSVSMTTYKSSYFSTFSTPFGAPTDF